MSVGSGSKQYTSPPHNFTSAHLAWPRASLLERRGTKGVRNKEKNPTKRSLGITNAQHQGEKMEDDYSSVRIDGFMLNEYAEITYCV